MSVQQTARKFEDLIVWQKAHAFVLAVYRITTDFPKHEQFGLTNQFRRASVSIPANIAEGWKRQGKADKLRFYNIAQASLEESRYYIILSKDLGCHATSTLTNLCSEVSKLLTAYMKKVK